MQITKPEIYAESLKLKTLRVLKRGFKSEYSFTVKVGKETVAYSPIWLNSDTRDEKLRQFLQGLK